MADSETDAESESIWESVRNEVEAANKRKNTEFFNPNKRQNMLDASEKSDTDSEINVGKINVPFHDYCSVLPSNLILLKLTLGGLWHNGPNNANYLGVRFNSCMRNQKLWNR